MFRGIPIVKIPFYKKILIRIFGKKKLSVDFGSNGDMMTETTFYKYKGTTYIYKCEVKG